jgi:hypothetical protein
MHTTRARLGNIDSCLASFQVEDSGPPCVNICFSNFSSRFIPKEALRLKARNQLFRTDGFHVWPGLPTGSHSKTCSFATRDSKDILGRQAAVELVIVVLR